MLYGLPKDSLDLPQAPSLIDGDANQIPTEGLPLQDAAHSRETSFKTLGACLASPFDTEDLNAPSHQRAVLNIARVAGGNRWVFN